MSNVDDMKWMFFGATSFNQPLDKWVNTQTGFLSNDAQEEFNFTYQSLLDYVGDTSIITVLVTANYAEQ